MKRILIVFILILISLFFGGNGVVHANPVEKLGLHEKKFPNIEINSSSCVRSYLEENNITLGLPSKGAYNHKRTSIDKLGFNHYYFEQQYQGIPIYGI